MSQAEANLPTAIVLRLRLREPRSLRHASREVNVERRLQFRAEVEAGEREDESGRTRHAKRSRKAIKSSSNEERKGVREGNDGRGNGPANE